MTPLTRYLTDMANIHQLGGVKETAFYPALSDLLNAVGRSLKPSVFCVIHPHNIGAGLADGGLFTPDQRAAEGEQPVGLPSRGAIEAKAVAEDVYTIARSEQVRTYLGRYRQVLVTTYREFLLVGQSASGHVELLESYSLAPNAPSFWMACALPEATAEEHETRFADYLRRVMLSPAPLDAPRDLARYLASYAREARARVEKAELQALDTVRHALEMALGLTFEGRRGEHFFRSTLVQTLFYGVFASWVLWCREHGERDVYNWHEAAWSLRVPMIRTLFEQVAQPDTLEPLGLVPLLDWAGRALNRVDRAVFFSRFAEHEAVQYFYEPFLEEFDPELRRQLGVWYTPPEIVRYMVARVDSALREELGRPQGLADPQVYVLDPCCGTGTYLVEVLRKISATLRKGGDALSASDLKKAALTRIFGFEIMPAPFVIAHLQLGLLLQSEGVPLAQSGGERAGVFLTNALTGWSDAVDKPPLPFPGLEKERDAAEAVKRERPILVILGNPPYSGYAGVAIGEERDLTEAYRKAIATKQPQGQGLNDLYVRFFRMAERRIVEGTREGIVCYISNYSWLDGLSFTAMRERYLAEFDHIWIDCLNGDKYKTGKVTPEGLPDPSIFSTEWNREGIQVGTAVALLVRRRTHVPATNVAFRHLWGRDKRATLLAEANGAPQGVAYETVSPATPLGLPFMPLRSNTGYLNWPLLADLFPTSFPGVKTSRDDVVVAIDRDALLRRMQLYFDPAISNTEIRRLLPGAMQSSGGFQAEAVRNYLIKRGFLPDRIVRYLYRPFDLRWLYWEPEKKLLDRNRSDYVPHVFSGNVWLSAGQHNRMEDFYQPQITTCLADHHIVESNVGMFRLYLNNVSVQATLFDSGEPAGSRANLSEAAQAYLAAIGSSAEDLFYHTIAILHAPTYRVQNAGALRQDWPRVPLPGTPEVLVASAALGRQVAALLDPECSVPGVTTGPLRRELAPLGVIARVGGGALNPEAGDLSVRATWGYAGQGGVTMPGKGRAVTRSYTSDERAVIVDGAPDLGLSGEEAMALLGEQTYDLYLNDRAFWCNVPERVWEYTIGGYQALKKWLSYREEALLGRSLHVEEAREFTAIVRRIAALRLLEPALDANYARVTHDTAPLT